MSEVAKDRLLAVGARFASFEHANNPLKDNGTDQYLDRGSINANSNEVGTQVQAAGGYKMSFWKKTSGKVPGRYALFRII